MSTPSTHSDASRSPVPGTVVDVAALTDTCAMGMALSKLPYNRSASCDIDQAVAALCER